MTFGIYLHVYFRVFPYGLVSVGWLAVMCPTLDNVSEVLLYSVTELRVILII